MLSMIWKFPYFTGATSQNFCMWTPKNLLETATQFLQRWLMTYSQTCFKRPLKREQKSGLLIQVVFLIQVQKPRTFKYVYDLNDVNIQIHNSYRWSHTLLEYFFSKSLNFQRLKQSNKQNGILQNFLLHFENTLVIGH